MKRKIAIVLLAAVLLTGCAAGDNPYRVDTVVYIPADSADVEDDAVPESQPDTQTGEETVYEETSAPTEPDDTDGETAALTEPEGADETAAPTEAEKKTSSTKKTTGSKKNNTGKKENASTVTEPAATEPAATEPVATEAAVTEAPETGPPVTEPPVTEPEPTEPPLYDISGYSVGSLEHAIKDAINAYRREAGLGELSLSARLSAIASCRGYEISQVWSHTRPDGRSYKTVLSDYGYGGSAQELLVYVSGNGDAQAIADKWMASDSHKELLLGGYSTIGIGIYRADGYTYIACLLAG